jgi:hypothetical protein
MDFVCNCTYCTWVINVDLRTAYIDENYAGNWTASTMYESAISSLDFSLTICCCYNGYLVKRLITRFQCNAMGYAGLENCQQLELETHRVSCAKIARLPKTGKF